jgi:hypothetical protein
MLLFQAAKYRCNEAGQQEPEIDPKGRRRCCYPDGLAEVPEWRKGTREENNKLQYPVKTAWKRSRLDGHHLGGILQRTL